MFKQNILSLILDTFLQVESMLEHYDWIVDERKFFGQPNTIYDFSTQDPKEAEKRIQKLSETKNKLSKSVNVRAMNLLGSAEEQVWFPPFALCSV